MDDVENFLKHHGVMGQRWGVRKDRKTALANVNRLSGEIAARQTQRRSKQTFTEDSLKKLSNKDVVIKRGSEIVRVSKDASGQFQSKQLYVSTNKQDATNYRGLVPTWETGGLPARKHEGYYETSYTALNDLKSPSERKRVEGYIKLMDHPDIKLDSGESITGREYLSRQGLGETIKHLSGREIALTYYGQLVANQGVSNEPLTTAYFKNMQQKGYNAIIDDNDRGIIASMPTKVLDAPHDLKTFKVQKLTTEDVHAALTDLRIPD
jgi:hypothetical protein